MSTARRMSPTANERRDMRRRLSHTARSFAAGGAYCFDKAGGSGKSLPVGGAIPCPRLNDGWGLVKSAGDAE